MMFVKLAWVFTCILCSDEDLSCLMCVYYMANFSSMKWRILIDPSELVLTNCSIKTLHKRRKFQLHFHESDLKKRKYSLKFAVRLPKFIDSLIYLQNFKRAVINNKYFFELDCLLVLY